jgi:hypothetical protein
MLLTEEERGQEFCRRHDPGALRAALDLIHRVMGEAEESDDASLGSVVAVHIQERDERIGYLLRENAGLVYVRDKLRAELESTRAVILDIQERQHRDRAWARAWKREAWGATRSARVFAPSVRWARRWKAALRRLRGELSGAVIVWQERLEPGEVVEITPEHVRSVSPGKPTD